MWATAKDESLEGAKILLIRPIDPDGRPTGNGYLAIDTVGAGAGEQVLVVDEGGSAGQVLGQTDPPIRTVIVGVVDEIEREPTGS